MVIVSYVQSMATLNRTEKLIRAAATGGNESERSVFDKLLEFFIIMEHIFDDKSHYNVIIYLYSKNHKGETFENIARKFHRSVSTLEENRRLYQKTFKFIYEFMQLNSAA